MFAVNSEERGRRMSYVLLARVLSQRADRVDLLRIVSAMQSWRLFVLLRQVRLSFRFMKSILSLSDATIIHVSFDRCCATDGHHMVFKMAAVCLIQCA